MVDIVLVATTNEAHAELSIEAMKCGKHVIYEKIPLSAFAIFGDGHAG